MNNSYSQELINKKLNGRYSIVSYIAKGGMASVYLAFDTVLERNVAVKIMHPNLANDENFVSKFIQEAKSAARVSHPNIINVYDQDTDGEYIYLVMEYFQGETLRQLLKRKHHLSILQSINIAVEVLSGLGAAHKSGIIHRDIKPENIFISDDNRIKIGDFGLARIATANTAADQALLGTVAYLSPELLTSGKADERSDIYALGIVCYEMLTGEQPYKGDDSMAIAYQHAHSNVPAPSEKMNYDKSKIVDPIIRWATQRDPDRRPENTDQLIKEFKIASEAIIHSKTDNITSPIDNNENTTKIIGVEKVRENNTLVFNETVQFAHPATQQNLSKTEKAKNQLSKRQARRKSLRIFWITLLSLASIGVSAFAWWQYFGPGTETIVPNIIGQEKALAESNIKNGNLQLVFTECNSTEYPVGIVVSQEPAPDTSIRQGSSVNACVSIGPKIVDVPDVKGMNIDQAISAIESAGLKYEKISGEFFHDSLEINTVIDMVDASGNIVPKQLSENSIVNLNISAGKFPDFINKPLDEAIKIAENARISYNNRNNTEEYSEKIPAGNVIDIIGWHENFAVGEPISFTVSLGPELIAVPDVSGKTIREAMKILADAGFKTSTSTPETLAGIDIWSLAKVNNTTPEANTKHKKGTVIDIKSLP